MGTIAMLQITIKHTSRVDRNEGLDCIMASIKSEFFIEAKSMLDISSAKVSNTYCQTASHGEESRHDFPIQSSNDETLLLIQITSL